ncbi:unnamed protein product, partial [marine sediment metagenome]
SIIHYQAGKDYSILAWLKPSPQVIFISAALLGKHKG